MRKYGITIQLVFCFIGITACSFVSLDPQARDVNVLGNVTSAKGCKFVGNTTVSLWSKADTFQSQKTVESQLDTLARNQAITMGGNTVAANSEINNGQRSYSVYNCVVNPTQ